MEPNTILMNFRLPNQLKSQFQSICQSQNVSMTSRLNILLLEFVKSKPELVEPNLSRMDERPIDDTWRTQIYDR